jgi:hypothetical protein
MAEIFALYQEVQASRKKFIETVKVLLPNQGLFKPTPSEWSAAEVTEHLYYAEIGGIWGMWAAMEKYQRSELCWSGENTNDGLSIEEVIDKTWKPKEMVPAVAAPKLFVSLHFWISALESSENLLLSFTQRVKDLELEKIIQPHPISGPLNVIQRYQFLRFHMDRHRVQVEKILNHPDYPREAFHVNVK